VAQWPAWMVWWCLWQRALQAPPCTAPCSDVHAMPYAMHAVLQSCRGLLAVWVRWVAVRWVLCHFRGCALTRTLRLLPPIPAPPAED